MVNGSGRTIQNNAGAGIFKSGERVQKRIGHGKVAAQKIQPVACGLETQKPL